MPTLRPWSAESSELKWAMSIAFICLMVFMILPFLPNDAAHTNEKKVTQLKTDHKLPPLAVQKQASTSAKVINKANTVQNKPSNKKTLPPIKKQIPVIKKQPKPTPVIAPQGYFIQIGAFKDQAHAQSLKDKLIKQHWPSIIQQKKQLYAVQIGPYKNKLKANAIKKKLFSREKINGFITHHAYP